MSTLIVDAAPSLLHPDTLGTTCAATLLPIDKPIPPEAMTPLVEQVHAGFRCADLLLRLPGAIPIPSFTAHPPLPSTDWVDISTQCFTPEVVNHLLEDPSSYPLHSPIPFPLLSQDQVKIPTPPRSIIQSPLLVRPPNPSVYTREGRSQFLLSIGIPKSAHDPDKTKILIVSFGGQIFHAPRSRSPSPAPSRPGTPNRTPRRGGVLVGGVPPSPPRTKGRLNPNMLAMNTEELAPKEPTVVQWPTTPALADLTNSPTTAHSQFPTRKFLRRRSNSQRIATDQHLWLPGAPSGVRKSEFSSPTIPCAQGFGTNGSLLFPASLPMVITTPASPLLVVPQGEEYAYYPHSPSILAGDVSDSMDPPRLLPDGWIAVVCGASKGEDEGAEYLPEGFYIAPKDVYMPDLTAVADVLLGKLVGLPHSHSDIHWFITHS